MWEFWLAVDDAYAEFAHAQIIGATITKPLSRERILDLTAGAVAVYVREQVQWDDAYEEPEPIEPPGSPATPDSPKSPAPPRPLERKIGPNELPKVAEHLAFARDVVAPSVSRLRVYLAEAKKRRWG
jgi:hypothetical protein